MLTTEIKINGIHLGMLCAVRGLPVGEIDKLEFVYSVEYSAFGKEKMKFDVMHNYEDGAEVLVGKCLCQIAKEIAKRKKKEVKNGGS